jgi:MFS superfamily sulfate permease-like transporter
MTMALTINLRGLVAAALLAATFIVGLSVAAYAVDPGLGVGRAGPGVVRRAPVARAAVVPGPVTALPAGCVSTIVNGVRVHRCGAVMYRPVVSAGRTTYVVVP